MFSILRKGNPAFYGTYPTAHIFQNYNLVHVSKIIYSGWRVNTVYQPDLSLRRSVLASF